MTIAPAIALLLAAGALAAPVRQTTVDALKNARKARQREAQKPPPEPRPAPGEKLWTDAPPARERPFAPPDIARLVKASMPAVVGIVATTAAPNGIEAGDPFKDFLEKMYGGRLEKSEPVRGIGTGFFIRKDGLIATNGHVIEGATDIHVQLGPQESPMRARVLGRDEPTDIALLEVDGPGPFPALALGDSDGLDVGEWVVAIGNPFGLSRSVTTGIISFKGRRDVNPSGRPGYHDFIQTDAAINPGNSGGPLLDARGHVVGMNAAVNPTGQGIGFAIPINMVKEIAPQLHARGYVARSWMGLSIQEHLTPELAASFGVPGGRGVLVTEVNPEGPADQAGLKVGDIVTSFDGEPLGESYRLRWLASIAGVDRVVKLGYWRSGKEALASVKLRERPGARPAPPKEQAGPKEALGLSVDDPGAGAEGVRVASVDVRGPAYRAGVREGDVVIEVDGEPVQGKAAFLALISRRPPSGVTRLYVRREGKPIFFGLRRDAPAAAEARGRDGAP